jgi:hypothetical protein
MGFGGGNKHNERGQENFEKESKLVYRRNKEFGKRIDSKADPANDSRPPKLGRCVHEKLKEREFFLAMCANERETVVVGTDGRRE